MMNPFPTGLPSAILCAWGSGLANATIFALVFPLVRMPQHTITGDNLVLF